MHLVFSFNVGFVGNGNGSDADIPEASFHCCHLPSK